MQSDDLERIAHRHGIRLLVQFGSSVTGWTHAQSDVDLAVLLDRASLSLAEHAELLHDLQSLFPEGEVDLVFLSRADPLLAHRIMEHARLVYGSATLFARRKIYAFKRYQDHRKYFDMERDFVRRSLAEPAAR